MTLRLTLRYGPTHSTHAITAKVVEFAYSSLLMLPGDELPVALDMSYMHHRKHKNSRLRGFVYNCQTLT